MMADDNKWKPQGEEDEEEEELDETVSRMSGRFVVESYLTVCRLTKPPKMLFYSLLKSASPCSLHHLQ